MGIIKLAVSSGRGLSITIVLLILVSLIVFFAAFERKKELIELIYISENGFKSLNETKDKFFSIIAHDLRSPFQAYLNISEIMATDNEDLTKEEMISLSKKLYTSLVRQYELLEDLLKWAQVSAGNMLFEPDYYDTSGEINQIFHVAMRNAQAKNIELITEIEPGVSVFADREMLNLVIRNLVANAIKFTEANGRIIVRVETAENNVKFSVFE